MRRMLILVLVMVVACTTTGNMIALHPETIPPEGIYSPGQVVVAARTNDTYEFAAAARPSFSNEQVKRVTYCGAQRFAARYGMSGWYEQDTVESSTPQMREVHLTATFYRGEKPYLVTNKNNTDWCS